MQLKEETAKKLLEKGLISQSDFDKMFGKSKESKVSVFVSEKVSQQDIPTLADVIASRTIREFDYAAKSYLLANPTYDAVKEILKETHRFKDQEGGKKLIALCYKLRDFSPPKTSPEEFATIIKKAFRKSNAKFPTTEENNRR